MKEDEEEDSEVARPIRVPTVCDACSRHKEEEVTDDIQKPVHETIHLESGFHLDLGRPVPNH